MIRTLLFDWGNTIMRDLPEYSGPMALWPRVEVMPGVGEALGVLHDRYRLVLATNAADSGAALVRAALQRARLESHFDGVYTARELGVRKPDPAFFRAVLHEIGCAPHEATMIGDDYRADVAGPKEIGMRAIWYNPADLACPVAQPLHDAEVQAMASLPSAVDGLHLPDLVECLALLAEQGASTQLLEHCWTVAGAAYRLAIRLLKLGELADPLLAHRGGLLHDLDKVTSRQLGRVHGQLGAELLHERGYPDLAEIAQRHLVYSILDPANGPSTWEEKLVFYADKVAEGSRLVSVQERLAALCGRYPHNAERMQLCLPSILALEEQICIRLGTTPAELRAAMSGNS